MCAPQPFLDLSSNEENKIYPSKRIFCIKEFRILKNLPCIEKRRDGFEGRLYPNHPKTQTKIIRRF